MLVSTCSSVRRVRPPLAAVVIACALASCGKCGDAGRPSDAAVPESAAEAASTPRAPVSAPPGGDAAPSPADAETSAVDAAPSEAGASSCRLVYGPAEQPFRGPAAIVVTPTELRLIANDVGKPRVYPIALTAPPPATARSVAPLAPTSFAAMRWPPCEIAGRWAYCQAPGGMVYRTTLGATDTKQIAKSRSSTRVAAVALGPDHAIVATLESHRTSEGEMLQAFVTLDDGEPQRLSDEGAGATVVRLVARDDRAIALYLDARMAMLPVHARPVLLAGAAGAARPAGGLALGDDAVVFVGGPPERGTELAVAAAGRSIFALLPMPRETTDFGVAALPIAERPKEEVQPVWSFYPNGLDPAPIVATVATVASASRGSGPGNAALGESAWVARVRPSERAPGAPRILELGRLDSGGVFTSLGAVVSGKHITDVAIAADAHESVWILYGDANATWLERRVCP